jgi:hypothetical protein
MEPDRMNSYALVPWLVGGGICLYCVTQTYFDIKRAKYGMAVLGALCALFLGFALVSMARMVFAAGIR